MGTHKDGMPVDLAAERAVLGAMMLSKDSIADVATTLVPDDFHDPGHRLLYSVVLGLFSAGIPADPTLVEAELDKQKQLETISRDVVHDLAHAPGARKDPNAAAQRVKDAAVLRATVDAARKAERLVTDADIDDADEVLEAAQSAFFKATSRQHPSGNALPLGDIMEGALDDIEAIGSRSGTLPGVPTGFTELDALTGGLMPGHLIVIAARPAMGKSTLAMDFLRSASVKHNTPSVLFSLQSGRNEITMRILSAEARVALHSMRSGTMKDEDWHRLAKRMPDVASAPLYIQDAGAVTLLDLRAQCRRLRMRNGVRLVVVDSLQTLDYGTRRFSSRYEEVSEIARGLKALAKELEIPIIAVSDLTRGPEQRTDKKPVISDLRDSGTLEEMADLVILLHREDAYERLSPRAGEADLIVAKHRQGPTATIATAFQGHYSRFVDMAQT
ncbi:replicative DNA helicase [Streptomyces sp. TLI_105]|uniref:replicative DNA helicase n=1 Tax=Streptomyces sp. TLI_105 TaxID=1881019 RepID=UPI0008962B23|nr:replicative DNA helicase [Streptomyces sp. TLI_105]SEB78323.1 replicative DNA helicase [Streptomyces sp. TLI_105]